jgi:hypothetical protein
MLRALLIQGFATGINIDAAVQKTGHRRNRSGLEQHPQPAAAPIASTGKLMRQRLRTSADKTLDNAPANAATGVGDPQEREEIRAVPVARAQEVSWEWTPVLPGCNLKWPCRQDVGL